MKRDCKTCDGKGKVEECLSVGKVLDSWPNADEIRRLQEDLSRCREVHQRLVHINPHATASYDLQLAQTIAVLNELAQALLEDKSSLLTHN